jgi:ankyrin repeat protein
VLGGDLPQLKVALANDREAVVRRHGPAEVTLLMLAAVRGDVVVVSCLLDAGADPNAVNTNGETCMILAAAAHRPELVHVLASAGAEVDHKDDLGMTALHRAVLGGRRGSTSAFDTVRALLDAGADATLADQQGRLPHQSARHRRWTWEVPLLRWQLSGYYPVGRNDPVSRLLEEAARPRR